MYSRSDSSLEATVLNRLPHQTKSHEYRSLDQFKSMLAAEGEHQHHDIDGAVQFLVFTSIDHPTFLRDFQEPIRDTCAHSIDAYLPQTKTLVIKMKRGPHEAAHSAINMAIMGKLHDMRLAERGLIGFDQTTAMTSSRWKEADVAYVPRRCPPGRSKDWPTFALESGYTDSQGMLDGNARWWLHASNGDTKIAMTIDLDRKWRRIKMRVYELSDNGNVDEQDVTISKPPNAQNTQVGSGSPLVISFRKLFLREPSNNEMDIELTDQDLIWIAEDTWDMQY